MQRKELKEFIRDNLEIIKFKFKPKQSFIDKALVFFKGLGKNQKNLMITVIFALSFLVCCGMCCFWCCRTKITSEDETSDDDEKGVEMANNIRNVDR